MSDEITEVKWSCVTFIVNKIHQHVNINFASCFNQNYNLTATLKRQKKNFHFSTKSRLYSVDEIKVLSQSDFKEHKIQKTKQKNRLELGCFSCIIEKYLRE